MLLLLFILLFPCLALGGTITDALESVYAPESPWTCETGISLSEYVPFGESRLEMLNALLSHMKLKAFDSGVSSGVSILTDDRETLGMTRRETGEGSGFRFSFDPDTLYIGEDFSDLTEASALQEELIGFPLPASLTPDLIRWADAGFQLLERLPEIFPEYAKISEVRTKLKDVGLSTRKTVVTLSADAVQEGLMSRLGQQETEASLKQVLRELVFSGRQQFTLYYDESGKLIKANYSGRAGRGEELRKITLEWRGLRNGESFDSLTCSAPAVSGGNKDSLSFTRNERDGESLRAELEWTRVRNRVKSVISGLADLTMSGEKGPLKGSITLTVKEGKKETGLILTPDFGWDQDGVRTGALGLHFLQDKSSVLEASLTFSLKKGAPSVPFGEKNKVKLSALGEEERAALKQQLQLKTASLLLRDLLTLPEKDLGFIRDEINEELWQQVLRTVNP